MEPYFMILGQSAPLAAVSWQLMKKLSVQEWITKREVKGRFSV